MLGPDHPQTLAAGHDLAAAHAAAGDLAAAIRLYERTLARRESVLGTDHPDTHATRTALHKLDRERPAKRRRVGDELGATGGSARIAAAAVGSVPTVEAIARRARAAAALPPIRALLRPRGARAPQPRTPLGQLVRAAAVAMVVIGALVIADATITLFWQEPITALIAAHNQGRVDHQLDRLFAGARQRAARQRETKRLIARQAAALDVNTPFGRPLGQIRIPRIGIKFAVIQGEDESSLELGPGHYPQTPLPGAAGHWTVGIAGHRTTYLAPFRNIDQLRRGDPIFVTMPYARFTYVVDRTIIVDPSNPTIFTAVGHNRLALTACNPPYSAQQRIIVYARQTRMAPLVRIEPARRTPLAPLERLWHGGRA